MPVRKCSNGKYRIGSGACQYDTRASAERAYRGYLGAKWGKKFVVSPSEVHVPVPLPNLSIRSWGKKKKKKKKKYSFVVYNIENVK